MTRGLILVLTLSAGSVAWSQSNGLAPLKTGGPGATLNPFEWLGTDYSKVQPDWQRSGFLAMSPTVVRVAGPAVRLGNAQGDSGMIHRVPKDRLGTLPEGSLVARNEYPGLRFQPILSPRGKIKAIPITWPRLEIKPIPNEYLNAQPLPLAGGAAVGKVGPVR
jgi:hypothetical protein